MWQSTIIIILSVFAIIWLSSILLKLFVYYKFTVFLSDYLCNADFLKCFLNKANKCGLCISIISTGFLQRFQNYVYWTVVHFISCHNPVSLSCLLLRLLNSFQISSHCSMCHTANLSKCMHGQMHAWTQIQHICPRIHNIMVTWMGYFRGSWNNSIMAAAQIWSWEGLKATFTYDTGDYPAPFWSQDKMDL